MKKDRTILVTGATGMLGGLIVRKIIKEHSFSRIILPVRNITKAQKLYADLSPEDSQKLDILSDCRNAEFSQLYQTEIHTIIHCACVTQSKEMFTHPVETADSILFYTKDILELAKAKQVESMIYLSSMEVYGSVENNGGTRTESELGYLDIHSPRSCYPMAKRMAEHYCHIYYEEYKVPVKIARLAQTFGRGVKPEDQRIYMQFARAVQEKKDIVLRTPGTSIGNYCHTQDAVDAVFYIMKYGKNGEVYNVVNENNTMSIREMAELVIRHFADGQIKIVYDVNKENRKIYAADTDLRLSSEKLRTLGWQPKADLIQMYQEILDMLTADPEV